MARIHAVLESIILDPTDDHLYAELDARCYLVWEWCITHGKTPWGWCPDRYCACKVALSEHEPDTLDGPENPWEALGENATRRAGSRHPGLDGPNPVGP